MSRVRDIQHPPRNLALKEASRALVRAAGGGEGAGETCGTRQQRVSDCINRNTADFLRIDEVGCLEDVTAHQPGAPHVTRVLARRQGYALVKLPDAIPGTTDLLKLVACESKEAGQITSSICEALSDGSPGGTRIVRSEAASVRTEIARLIEIAVAMDAALAAIEAGETE